MKFRLLLRMRGNGRVGSSVVGLKSGTISVRKYCSSQLRCAGDQSSRRTKRMPASRSAGISSSLRTRYCSVTSAFASSATVRSTSRGAQIVGAGRRRVHGESVLQAGHANLEELVEVRRRDAEELEALEQRHARVHRLLQHAQIERKLRQLAVDVVVRKFEIQRVHLRSARLFQNRNGAETPVYARALQARPGRSSHRSVGACGCGLRREPLAALAPSVPRQAAPRE